MAREEPRVIYQDDDLAVVLKPPGWSCLPNPKGLSAQWAGLKELARRRQIGELMGQAVNVPLQAWLLLHFGCQGQFSVTRNLEKDCGLAHRIDVDTSGPVLVGLTQKGFVHAKKEISHGILKDYVALVHGSFSTERGECRAPIDTSTYLETKRVRIDPTGQPAATIWEALAEYESPKRERFTLVHLRMLTQRTQQLRVHMHHLGHAVVGDRLYGGGERPAWCPRIFVHKVRIGFFSVEGEACIEHCSLRSAPDLWQALGQLRKVGGMAAVGCGAPGL